MKDSHGKTVKVGDTIKTDRGVELEITDVNGSLYMLNIGNGQESSLDIISVDFYIQDPE